MAADARMGGHAVREKQDACTSEIPPPLQHALSGASETALFVCPHPVRVAKTIVKFMSSVAVDTDETLKKQNKAK